MVSGVVLLSLVVQGLSIGPLLRRLGILGGEEGQHELETITANRIRASAASRKLDELQETGQVPPGVRLALVKEIEGRETEARLAQESMLVSHPNLASAQTREIRRNLLLAERAAIDLALHHGQIDSLVAEETSRNIDDALLELGESH